MSDPGDASNDPSATRAPIPKPPDGPIIAFAGPCLPRQPGDRWNAVLENVELWPPARRGDILRALGRRPRALVLLDGLYYSVPSVTHKELLYALDSGVLVVGAASMGALRATEMAPFGMVGRGYVFERFHGGELDGDDEVAMLHTLADDGYRPITLALVEIRHALEEILDETGQGADTGEAFIAAAKALPFTERSRARLLELASEHLSTLDSAARKEILDRVLRGGVKQLDALEALEWTVKQSAAGTAESIHAQSSHAQRTHAQKTHAQSPPAQRTEAPLITTLFNLFRGWALRPEVDDSAAREPASYFQAWQVAQLFHPEAPSFLDRQRRRFITASAAEAAGLQPTEAQVTELADAFDLHLRGYPLPRLEVEAEARLEALARAGARHFGIDDSWQGRGFDAAATEVAKIFGLSAPDRLLELLAIQGDLLQPWRLARALLLTPARAPAVALASAAFQVQRAWSSVTRGGRLARPEIRRLAAGLFGCRPEDAEEAGIERGLLTSSEGEASTGTLAEAIVLVAAAERLPQPANDYPRWRDELPRASLEPLYGETTR